MEALQSVGEAFFPLLRSEMYRLVRSRAVWGCAVASIASVLVSDASFDFSRPAVSSASMLATLCVYVGVFAGGALAVRFCDELDCGAMKATLAYPGSRCAYALVTAVIALLVAALMTLGDALALTLRAYLRLGIWLPDCISAPLALSHLLRTTLVSAAVALFAVFAALLFSSKSLGVFAAVVGGYGIPDVLLTRLLAHLGAESAARYLHGSGMTVIPLTGWFESPAVPVAAIVFAALMLMATMLLVALVMRTRDVSGNDG